MSEIIKYELTFQQTKIRVSDTELTFSIGNIKSRTPSVVYFKFIGYDLRNQVVAEYTSSRWVIPTEYTQRYETFDLEFAAGKGIEDLDSYVIKMYTLGLDSENPLYFNKVQLNSGELLDYHTPNEEIANIDIGFKDCSYVNLYDASEKYLQIIRPNKEGFTTGKLTNSQCTILVPHLPDESEFDDPVAILYEYMYQTEQEIGVEK